MPNIQWKINHLKITKTITHISKKLPAQEPITNNDQPTTNDGNPTIQKKHISEKPTEEPHIIPETQPLPKPTVIPETDSIPTTQQQDESFSSPSLATNNRFQLLQNPPNPLDIITPEITTTINEKENKSNQGKPAPKTTNKYI